MTDAKADLLDVDEDLSYQLLIRQQPCVDFNHDRQPEPWACNSPDNISYLDQLNVLKSPIELPKKKNIDSQASTPIKMIEKDQRLSFRAFDASRLIRKPDLNLLKEPFIVNIFQRPFKDLPKLKDSIVQRSLINQSRSTVKTPSYTLIKAPSYNSEIFRNKFPRDCRDENCQLDRAKMIKDKISMFMKALQAKLEKEKLMLNFQRKEKCEVILKGAKKDNMKSFSDSRLVQPLVSKSYGDKRLREHRLKLPEITRQPSERLQGQGRQQLRSMKCQDNSMKKNVDDTLHDKSTGQSFNPEELQTILKVENLLQKPVVLGKYGVQIPSTERRIRQLTNKLLSNDPLGDAALIVESQIVDDYHRKFYAK